MVKVGSLFSGIGGLDLGLERAGMEIVWQVENNPFCQKVLKKHWPEVPCYGDIKEIDFTTLPAVDLICGGFPCQSVSCAGKRQGDKDERWLWPEFYRGVCEARPRWVLVENVPGLLSASDGRLFGGILGDLARSGYDAEWDLLPAATFGAPHLRFRLFLVAYARGGAGLGRALEQGRETKGGTAAGGDGEKISNADQQHGNGSRFYPGSISQQQEAILPGCKDVSDPPGPRCTPGRPDKSRKVRDEARGPEPERRSDATDSNAIGRHGWPEVFGSGRRGEFENSDWWLTEPDLGRVAHGIPSRVDRLKCLGNAVVPQVVEWIGKRIMQISIDNLGESR